MNGGQITNNTAVGASSTDGGGGVYIRYAQGQFVMDGGSIDNNIGQRGGGVQIYEGTFTLNDGQIDSNTALNTSRSGGGVYVRTTNATFIQNGGQVSNNFAAWRGGGLFVLDGQGTLNAGDIISNTATYGGGVYVYNPAGVFTQNGGSVAYNHSTRVDAFGGGGMYIFQGTADLLGGDFSNNTALYNGGGLQLRFGTLQINGTTFAGNQADFDNNNTGQGDAIYNDDGMMTIYNSSFNSNGETAVTIVGGTNEIIGNNFTSHPTVFEITDMVAPPTITLYANNILTFTTGISQTGSTATFYNSFNWWGSTNPTGVGNSNAEDFRLGAPVVDWSNNGTLGQSSLSEATATGLGTAVIINHDRTTASEPFGNQLTTIANLCSDYYTMFVVGGDGTSTWNMTIPVDDNAFCNANVAGGTISTNRLHLYDTLVSGAPNTSCIDGACWSLALSITRNGGSPPYTLTANGVPVLDLASIVAGDETVP